MLYYGNDFFSSSTAYRTHKQLVDMARKSGTPRKHVPQYMGGKARPKSHWSTRDKTKIYLLRLIHVNESDSM